jgi:hypothetical protein
MCVVLRVWSQSCGTAQVALLGLCRWQYERESIKLFRSAAERRSLCDQPCLGYELVQCVKMHVGEDCMEWSDVLRLEHELLFLATGDVAAGTLDPSRRPGLVVLQAVSKLCIYTGAVRLRSGSHGRGHWTHWQNVWLLFTGPAVGIAKFLGESFAWLGPAKLGHAFFKML